MRHCPTPAFKTGGRGTARRLGVLSCSRASLLGNLWTGHSPSLNFLSVMIFRKKILKEFVILLWFKHCFNTPALKGTLTPGE